MRTARTLVLGRYEIGGACIYKKTDRFGRKKTDECGNMRAGDSNSRNQPHDD